MSRSSAYRFRLLLSYKGTGYYGWQRQKNLKTIQGTIEQSLQKLFQKDIALIGSGRTDAGTHAIGQSAHFDLPFLPKNLNIQKALNAFLLPQDICVRKVWIAPLEFHSLHSAIRKRYIYFILNRKTPCVFRKEKVYWKSQKLDFALLNILSQKIIGTKDFKSFQNKGTEIKNTVRTIFKAEWKMHTKDILAFHIEGDGFLKQMIRNLVGAQLKILSVKQPLPEWEKILQFQTRKQAYSTVPAQGLYLYKVFYPEKLDKKCRKI